MILSDPLLLYRYPIALNYFPKAPLTEPQRFVPHCVYGAAGERGWRVSPQPVPIQVLTFLGGAGRPGGGGTYATVNIS